MTRSEAWPNAGAGEAARVTIHKCPCGHSTCDQYTLSTQGGVGFSLADATLYAAAHELLEAAKNALATIENTLRARGYSDGSATDKWSGEVRIEVGTRAKLRAAIAKATTPSPTQHRGSERV